MTLRGLPSGSRRGLLIHPALLTDFNVDEGLEDDLTEFLRGIS